MSPMGSVAPARPAPASWRAMARSALRRRSSMFTANVTIAAIVSPERCDSSRKRRCNRSSTRIVFNSMPLTLCHHGSNVKDMDDSTCKWKVLVIGTEPVVFWSRDDQDRHRWSLTMAGWWFRTPGRPPTWLLAGSDDDQRPMPNIIAASVDGVPSDPQPDNLDEFILIAGYSVGELAVIAQTRRRRWWHRPRARLLLWVDDRRWRHHPQWGWRQATPGPMPDG